MGVVRLTSSHTQAFTLQNPHGTSSGMAFSAVAAPRPDDAGDAPPCLSPKPGKPCSALPSACCTLASAAAATVGGRTISIAAGRPRRPRPPAHRKYASTVSNNNASTPATVKARCPGVAPAGSGQRCRRRGWRPGHLHRCWAPAPS